MIKKTICEKCLHVDEEFCPDYQFRKLNPEHCCPSLKTELSRWDKIKKWFKKPVEERKPIYVGMSLMKMVDEWWKENPPPKASKEFDEMLPRLLNNQPPDKETTFQLRGNGLTETLILKGDKPSVSKHIYHSDNQPPNQEENPGKD